MGSNSVESAPTGTASRAASVDETVRLWDADTGQPIGAPLAGHTDTVNEVHFSPDGHRLASASSDGTIRIGTPTPTNSIDKPLIVRSPD